MFILGYKLLKLLKFYDKKLKYYYYHIKVES